MLWLWILIAVVVLAVVGGVISYNRFISQKNLIKDAWANIDTELKRRYDLIPNLVETVKGYAAHEKEVFEEVARTRSMAAGATGSPAAQAAAEGPLVAALGKLFAVAENYPDLKANQNFLELQRELTNTEDRLQTARRFYNANVREYNQRVKQFPSVIVASVFHFEEAEFFEVEEAIREAGAPQVDFGTAWLGRHASRRRRRRHPATAGRRRAGTPRAAHPAEPDRLAVAQRRRPRARARFVGVLVGSAPSSAGPLRTLRVRIHQTPAHTTATPPNANAACRGPAASAIQEAARLEIPNDSVISAKSTAKMRPRMWSGTSTCSP